MEKEKVVEQQAARAILVSPEKEVLLLKLKADPMNERHRGMDFFWITPGGRLEEGESYEEGLQRELYEETGITDAVIERELFLDSFTFYEKKIPRNVSNRYYLLRTKTTEVTDENLYDYEREQIVELRWWSLSEINATKETIFPSVLIDHLRLIL